VEQISAKWLLLIHQLPPKPAYLRVKIWRRLQGLGSVAIKSSVYALPANDQTLEDFRWLRQEIVKGGADATVCEARFIDGLSDHQVEELFNNARDQDYAEVDKQTRDLLAVISGKRTKWVDRLDEIAGSMRRLRKRFSAVVAIDFFGANGRESAEGLLASLETRLKEAEQKIVLQKPAKPEPALSKLKGRIWVTRQGVGIDRIGSAWLIKRFIDPEAVFKFVPADYAPKHAEVRFDMFDAEYTHHGDKCTFEVLLELRDVKDPSLQAIAEIVHDVDLKDGKFARSETSGIANLIAGIAIAHRKDEERLRRGAAVFDDLYEYFRKGRR
jgi:hypothetical protein